MSDTITIELPRERAGDYLRWIAFWREVEAFMLNNPAVARGASEDAGPFLYGEDAQRISLMAAEITGQAQQARERNEQFVAPRVTVPREARMLAHLGGLMLSRGRWVDEHGPTIGLAPLDEDLRELRHRIIARLLDQAEQLAAGETGP